MRILAAFLLLLLCSCGTTRISANAGKAELDSDLKPLKSPTLVGLEFSDVPEEGGLGYEIGGHYGRDTGSVDGESLRSELFEGYIGPRYEFRLGQFSPYISGGADVLSYHGLFGDLGSTVPDRDTDIGFYAGLGVDFDFADHWMMGLGARATFDHDLQLSGVKGNADAWQFLFRFGYYF